MFYFPLSVSRHTRWKIWGDALCNCSSWKSTRRSIWQQTSSPLWPSSSVTTSQVSGGLMCLTAVCWLSLNGKSAKPEVLQILKNQIKLNPNHGLILTSRLTLNFFMVCSTFWLGHIGRTLSVSPVASLHTENPTHLSSTVYKGSGNRALHTCPSSKHRSLWANCLTQNPKYQGWFWRVFQAPLTLTCKGKPNKVA